MRHYLIPSHKHTLGDLLNAAAKRRNRQKKAAWGVMLMVMLYVVLGLQQAHAVVPYRSPEDYGPSLEARNHLPACRRAAMETMAAMANANGVAGGGKIESESFVQRADAEYFRFVMRNGTREVLIICDGHAGVIRRQIDIWGDL
ncbi:hypothetical protein hmeg3_06075 [Herbaspirillum sp. meg3]|uniref:hypothetical protein n=1 Tax=Herbaspirillum sp. meg3 TaxID=2025949 RepID=UPI000B997410|nr:hypothetical protein [Herbaspirillum sp. meg3]ASU37904.1 hypothetical protein hmeg3_06075 [Herbaspirillum sp. meg3]